MYNEVWLCTVRKCVIAEHLSQYAVKGTEGRHAVTHCSSSPQDNKASSAGPLARRCHGCKGGEGEAVSSGNTRCLFAGRSDCHLGMT